MLPSHKKILDVLKQGPATLKKIERETGLSPDSIRGRISEMRKRFNCDVQKINGRYCLALSKSRMDADRILSAVGERNLYGHRLGFPELSTIAKMPEGELPDALSELYHRGQLLQFSKDTVIIYKSIR